MFTYSLILESQGSQSLYRFRSPHALKDLSDDQMVKLAEMLNIDYYPGLESLSLVEGDEEFIALTDEQVNDLLYRT